MAKVKINLSLDEDTADRIKKHAKENHKTVSQDVTDWIWKENISEDKK